jgi:hypothetical protein
VFIFIESSIFERVRPAYLDDDEYAELQQFLMQNPVSGSLSPDQAAFVKRVGHERAAEREVDSESSTMCGISPMSFGC